MQPACSGERQEAAKPRAGPFANLGILHSPVNFPQMPLVDAVTAWKCQFP